MEDYNKNALDFLRSTFSGKGHRFAIQTTPKSFQTSKKGEKKKTKEEILKRLSKIEKDSLIKFFEGELKIELICNFNKRYEKTDVDNIAKFTLDCMKGIAFKDDCQIKELIIKKIKCSPGVKEYIGVGISKL